VDDRLETVAVMLVTELRKGEAESAVEIVVAVAAARRQVEVGLVLS
jgi:hypothetical protein